MAIINLELQFSLLETPSGNGQEFYLLSGRHPRAPETAGAYLPLVIGDSGSYNGVRFRLVISNPFTEPGETQRIITTEVVEDSSSSLQNPVYSTVRFTYDTEEDVAAFWYNGQSVSIQDDLNQGVNNNAFTGIEFVGGGGPWDGGLQMKVGYFQDNVEGSYYECALLADTPPATDSIVSYQETQPPISLVGDFEWEADGNVDENTTFIGTVRFTGGSSSGYSWSRDTDGFEERGPIQPRINHLQIPSSDARTLAVDIHKDYATEDQVYFMKYTTPSGNTSSSSNLPLH